MKEQHKNDDADAIAYQKAIKEVDTLLFGMKMTNLAQVEDIRDYARKRTDLRKDDKDLTSKQRAWKKLYIFWGDRVEEYSSKEMKEHIDDEKSKIDSLNFVNSKTEEAIELGREIEANFFLQWSIITMNWEPDQNVYKTSLNKIFKDKTLTNAERIDGANKILENADNYRKEIMKKLHDYHYSIYTGLTKFEANSTWADLLDELCKISGDNSGENKVKEWLKLSWDLYENRTAAITSVDREIDFDEYMANELIKNQGDSSKTMTKEEKKESTEKFACYASLKQTAYEFMRDIEPKRVKISESCFGKLNDYINTTKLAGKLQEDIKNSTTDSPKPKKGFWSNIFK